MGKKRPEQPARPRTGGFGASRGILVMGLLCVVIALVYAHLAPGTYQDDDVDRYFMARQVWRDPSLLLDRWGMPLSVALFAVPARLLGYSGVEAVSALATAGAAMLTALAAWGLGWRRPWVAGLFVFFQPMVLNLSYSGLAEPLGALLIAGTLGAWYNRRPSHAVGWASLLPLARIETGLLTLVVLAAAWRRVGWRTRVGALVPGLAWNLAGFATTGDPFFVFSLGGARPLNSLGVLHYLRNEIIVAGPVVLFFFLWALAARADRAAVADRDEAGTSPRVARERDEAGTSPRVARDRGEVGTSPKAAGDRGFPALATILFTAHFLVLTLLAWEALPFGRSIGFLRHLVATAPALALTAAWGAQVFAFPSGGRTVTRIALAVTWPVVVAVVLSHKLIAGSFLGEGRAEWRWMVSVALALVALLLLRKIAWRRVRGAAIVLAGVAALAVALLVVRPIELDPERQAVARVVKELRAAGLENAVTYTNHPWFTFLAGRDRYDLTRTPHLTRQALETARPGSVVLWENHYGHRLWGDVPEGYLENDPRFVLLMNATAGVERNFRLAVYARDR